MTVSLGPKTNTSGLVFAYDMKNTNKSWRGQPTTNLYYAVNNYLNGNGNHWVNSGSATFNDNDTSISPPDNPGVGLPSTLRITSCTTTAVGNQQCGMNITTVSASTTYTMSVWVYIKGGPTVYTGANGTAPYMRTNVNNNALAYFSYNGSTDTTTWPRFQWIRISVTGTTQSNENGIYLSSYIGNTVGDIIYYYGFQVEQNSFATPLVAGARSSSAAVVDLTNNNTITATNLTYNSDGTFKWSAGTDARLQSPSSSNFAFGTGDFTVECWINPDNFSGYTHMVALPDQNTFGLKANTGDGAIYFYSSSFTTYPTTGWTLTAGSWNHVILTRVSGTSYSYLNGQLKGSKAGFSNSFSSQVLNIGNGFSGEYTGKSISNVKIYNRGLSADEVRQNYDSSKSLYGLS